MNAVLSFASSLLEEAMQQGSPWLVLGYVLTSVLIRFATDADDLRSRRQLVGVLLALNLVLLPFTALATSLDAAAARDLRLTGSVAGVLAAVGMAGLVAFGVVLPRLRILLPRILQDVIVAGFGIVAVFGTASRAGVNLSGIVATGAVLTAVIGLALQDTLGNVVGGLALQLDSTVRVGDWIRVADVSGRVIEIRWRSVSIETRNWETVVIPNSVLTRSQVVVLGRRTGEAPRWRRWVYFQVDFRSAPTLVIETVLQALTAQPIGNVAASPPPNCILMDLGESTARYAVRYWLLDFAHDDATDSIVRTRIYFALARAGIPLSIPAQSVFVTEESAERRELKHDADRARRIEALSKVDLFSHLSTDERTELAHSLRPAPFTAGETLTREGSEAHHLYVVLRGSVSIRVGEGGAQREVAQLGSGEFFGEMSLLTGQKRSATVVALTDVDCYRLDADAFRRVLERRPDLAERVAEQLAVRQRALLATRDAPSHARASDQVDARDLVRRIRSFFGL